MSDKPSYANDALKHIADLTAAIAAAKSIKEVETAWDHFYRLEGFVERTWPTDKAAIEALRRTKSGLSAYTRDVREGMPSPFEGWRSDLFRLEQIVRPQFGKDGWPL